LLFIGGYFIKIKKDLTIEENFLILDEPNSAKIEFLETDKSLTFFRNVSLR